MVPPHEQHACIDETRDPKTVRRVVGVGGFWDIVLLQERSGSILVKFVISSKVFGRCGACEL